MPPNIFDGFQLAAVVSLQHRATAAEREVKRMKAKIESVIECLSEELFFRGKMTAEGSLG